MMWNEPSNTSIAPANMIHSTHADSLMSGWGSDGFSPCCVAM